MASASSGSAPERFTAARSPALPAPLCPTPDKPRYATFSENSSEFILGPVSKHRWIYDCAKELLERALHACGLHLIGLEKLPRVTAGPAHLLAAHRPQLHHGPPPSISSAPILTYYPASAAAAYSASSPYLLVDALFHAGPMKLVNGGRRRRCYTNSEDAIDCILRIV